MEVLRLGSAAWRLRAVVAVLAGVAAAASVEARVTRIVIDSTTAVTGQAHPLRDAARARVRRARSRTTRTTRSSPTSSSARTPTARSATRPRSRSPSRSTWRRRAASCGTTCRTAAATSSSSPPSATSATSAWRAAGRPTTPARPRCRPTTRPARNHWVVVPMARENGQLVTGKVLARIVNRSGVDSQPLNVMGNPVPYLPASLDTTQAVLTTHTKETVNGQVTDRHASIPSTDWSFAHCSATTRSPARRRHQRSQPARQPAGPRLPEERLRSDAALPAGLSRPRARTCSASAWPRSATSARSSSTRPPTTSAPPIRSPARSPARRSAASRSRATSRASSSTSA